MAVTDRMASVPARILPSPILSYNRPECMDVGDRGAWNLRGVRFPTAARLDSYAVVSFVDARDADLPGENGLGPFTLQLKDMLDTCGEQTILALLVCVCCPSFTHASLPCSHPWRCGGFSYCYFWRHTVLACRITSELIVFLRS